MCHKFVFVCSPVPPLDKDCFAPLATNKSPNSPTEKHARLVSLPYAVPLRHLLLALGYRSQWVPAEGSLIAEDHTPFWTSEELIDRRTSFAQHLATTADLIDAM